MNERDSEIIAQSLSKHNYVESMDMDSAELIVLNTCSIRAKAEQKVMSLLGQLRKNKKNKPGLTICVAGCVAQQLGESILERMPHVDLIIGTQHIYSIAELVEKAKTTPAVETSLTSSYNIPRFIPDIGNIEALPPSQNKKPVCSRFVTIMQGCNNYCTYCVVPYTRGRESSRNFNDIVDEVKVLVEQGVVEITLLGQNVNSYGQTNQVREDGRPCSFSQLLREVASIEGVRRLRFTTSNPKDLSEDLMRCFRDLENLCPQFHLPVQAGSNRILKRMNRKYTIERYIDLVNSLRRYRPDIVITTDIIVGFPGETEEDFQDTMNLLETVRFDGSFSFKYSDRPGTASSQLPEKIDEKVKSQRLTLFQRRQNEISLERNNGYLGKTLEVMVESCSGPLYQCRATTNHVVHVESAKPLSIGQLISARIHHAGQHSLKGVVEDEERVGLA